MYFFEAIIYLTQLHLCNLFCFIYLLESGNEEGNYLMRVQIHYYCISPLFVTLARMPKRSLLEMKIYLNLQFGGYSTGSSNPLALRYRRGNQCCGTAS